MKSLILHPQNNNNMNIHKKLSQLFISVLFLQIFNIFSGERIANTYTKLDEESSESSTINTEFFTQRMKSPLKVIATDFISPQSTKFSPGKKPHGMLKLFKSLEKNELHRFFPLSKEYEY